jgi:hypothetical protein
MSSSVSLAVWTLIGAVAVAGAGPCPATGPRPDNSKSTASPTKVVDPADFTYVQGATQFPWTRTEKYRSAVGDPAADDLFDRDFPAEGHDLVRLCEHCELVDVVIAPEKGSHLLEPDSFAAGLRVIARVELKDTIQYPTLANGLDSVTILTGLAHLGDVAYLVALSHDRAAFMFDDGGKIAFTPAWEFDPEVHPEHALGVPQARWKRRHDGSVTLGSGVREHLSGAWLSCADGCCTATPLQ